MARSTLARTTPNRTTSRPTGTHASGPRPSGAPAPAVASGFDRFGLDAALLRGIRDLGFTHPRPIQDETIPAGLEGRDVLGLAQTGTGKTAAFALPILHRLLDRPGKGPRVLVLAPTRELATQIATETRALALHTRVRTVTVYGGVSMYHQIDALRLRPEIVVGCPGRVLDLLQQGVLKLGEVETLVLDEADHMFDMGFLRDVRKIVKALPRQRQNLLFSATMPHEIRGLADELLRKPLVVELSDARPAETIDHAIYDVSEARKRDLLDHFLDSDECSSAIVFTRTKHRAKKLARDLIQAGHRAIGLQGNMSQNARDRAMSGFRTRVYDVLVATDIAARGIDVSGVSHVINFDVPNTPEAYTHRIGRTGRAEREGIACTFVTHEDAAWVRATERMLGEPIERRRVNGFEANGAARGRALGTGYEGASGNGRGRAKAPGRANGAGRAQAPGRTSGGGRTNGRARANAPAAAPTPATPSAPPPGGWRRRRRRTSR